MKINNSRLHRRVQKSYDKLDNHIQNKKLLEKETRSSLYPDTCKKPAGTSNSVSLRDAIAT